MTIETDEEVVKPKPRIVEFEPKIKFCEIGSLVTNKEDIYPTLDKWGNENQEDQWHGMGGNAKVFSAGSNLMLLEQVQFYMNGKALVRVHLLNGDQSGWATVIESSRAKEWDWMIPLKRAKVVKDMFNNLFQPLVEEEINSK